MSAAHIVTAAVWDGSEVVQKPVACRLMIGSLVVTPHQRHESDKRKRMTYTVTHVRTGYAVLTDVPLHIARAFVRLCGEHPLWAFGMSDLDDGASRVRDSDVWPAIVAARDWRVSR